MNNMKGLSPQAVYNDAIASFEEFLVKDKTLTIHFQHIQSLAIEMFYL